MLVQTKELVFMSYDNNCWKPGENVIWAAIYKERPTLKIQQQPQKYPV